MDEIIPVNWKGPLQIGLARGEKTYVWEGAYGRRNKAKLPLYRARLAEIGPQLQDFLSRLHFFLLPMESDRRTRERLEAALSHKLNHPFGSAGQLQDIDIRYRPCRAGEPVIVFRFARSLPIEGLSEVTEIILPS